MTICQQLCQFPSRTTQSALWQLLAMFKEEALNWLFAQSLAAPGRIHAKLWATRSETSCRQQAPRLAASLLPLLKAPPSVC